MAKVLITGAQSRIGQIFVQLMSAKEEHHLTFLSISQLRLADLSPGEFPLDLSDYDAVLHFSWPASSFAGDYRTSPENVVARDKTIYLGQLCRDKGTWLIGIGSVLDGDLFKGSSDYADTKRQAKVSLFQTMEGSHFTWARPFWVFEPMHWPRFLFSRCAIPTVIEDDRERDFIHIGDVATALMTILENNLEGSIDIGSTVPRSPSSILEALGMDYRLQGKASATWPDEFPVAKSEPLSQAGWTPSITSHFFDKDSTPHLHT